MNWQELRGKIQWKERERPQVSLLCELSLREIENHLQILAKYGHHFSLIEGHSVAKHWPRTAYHFSKGSVQVLDEFQFKELGEGWAFTPLDAHILEGHDKQNEIRGGIPRKIGLIPQGEAEFVEGADEWKKTLKREFLNGSGAKLKEERDGNK